MPEAKFQGQSIRLGDRDFIVPPIALGKLKTLHSRLADIKMSADGSLAPESLDTVVDLTLAALNRNYPDLTKQELEELLDLGNVAEVLRVVTGQSGLVERGKAGLEGTSP